MFFSSALSTNLDQDFICYSQLISLKVHFLLFILVMTTNQIEAENTQVINDLYRLLKKYSGLRNLIRQLKVRKSIITYFIYVDDVL